MTKPNKPRHRFSLKSCSNGGKALRGGEFADEVRVRALLDAKGSVLRSGVTYTAAGAQHWQKRRALLGRTDQIELVCDGGIVKTTGQTRLKGAFSWLKHA